MSTETPKVTVVIAPDPDGASALVTLAPAPAETISKPRLEIVHPETKHYWGAAGWQPTRFAWDVALQAPNEGLQFRITPAPRREDLPESGVLRLAVPAALLRAEATWPVAVAVIADDTPAPVVTEAIAAPPPDLSSGQAVEARRSISWAAIAMVVTIGGTAGAMATYLALQHQWRQDLATQVARLADIRAEETRQTERAEQLAARSRAVAATEEAAQRSEKEMAARQIELQRKEVSLQEQSTQFNQLRQNAGPEIARLSRLQDQLRAERSSIEALAQQVSAERQANSDAKADIDRQTREIAALRQILRDDVDSIRKSDRDHINHLESELRKEQKVAGGFDALSKSLENKVKTLESKIQELESKNATPENETHIPRFRDVGEFSICNRTGFKIDLALITLFDLSSEHTGERRIRGWYTINNNSCYTGIAPKGILMFAATGPNGRRWGSGAGSYCVYPTRMDHRYFPGNCGPGAFSMTFSQMVVGDNVARHELVP